jgi:hypothetical protein
MNAECTEEKLTDSTERGLIERELDDGSHRVKLGAGALLFEAAVVVMMLLAMCLLAARPF